MQRVEDVATGHAFGTHVREARERLAARRPAFSQRQVALRCGVTPAYLSRVERGEVAPPGEGTVRRMAADLGEDPDMLLALAGKVSADLREAILARPKLLAQLIRAARQMPEQAILKLVREVRDGEW